jgi:hypothetical protein
MHNGSVRTVYQMISPREERDATWWSGTREYDPVELGFRSLQVPGAVQFDTRVTGNDNTGHEFRAGCQANGVIGPYLEPAERRQILEYLKVMDYVDDPQRDFEERLCKGEASVADCEARMDARRAELRARYPEWGSAAFNASAQQAHCSSDAVVYGKHLLPDPQPDEEWETWRMAKDCSLYDLYLNADGPFRGE